MSVRTYVGHNVRELYTNVPMYIGHTVRELYGTYAKVHGNCRHERHKWTSREPFTDIQAFRQTFRPNLGFVHALNVSYTSD